MDPLPPAISFAVALRFWLKLGFISFGGPAGQIALMHRELVEKRRWISEGRFLHALNFCMLLPGPEAQQLATYLGWLMHRSWGGIVAGSLFVLPSMFILIGLSWLYMAWGETPLLAGLFYGIKPAVTAIVLHAAWRIGGRTLHNAHLWAIAVAAFVAIYALAVPFPLIVAAAALAGYLSGRKTGGEAKSHGQPAKEGKNSLPAIIDDDTPAPPHARHSTARLLRVLAGGLALWALPMGLLTGLFGWSHVFTQMGWFFTKAAFLTFGGAYAVLPYVHQAAVLHYGWLSASRMMDGLALGETTPGPLIMVVAFVAFVGAWGQSPFGDEHQLAAAALAAVLVTWFTFLPSFVFILLGGPVVEATRDQPHLTAPLAGITAAVVGVIVNLALFFALHVLWPQGLAGGLDPVALGITALSALALFRWRLGVLQVIGGAALLGLLWRLATNL
jgi:chromate transporter